MNKEFWILVLLNLKGIFIEIFIEILKVLFINYCL